MDEHGTHEGQTEMFMVTVEVKTSTPEASNLFDSLDGPQCVDLYDPGREQGLVD